MTKFFVAYIFLMLLLIGVAIYQHVSSAELSLPIYGLTISTILLLLFALTDSIFCSRWAKGTRAHRAVGRGLWLSQALATIVSATLFFSYIPSSDARDCLFSTVWQRLFSSHDAQTIRRIQDTFNCCGFNTVRDRAWPFPNHETARRCEEMYGRTAACVRPFRTALQSACGVEFGVIVISGLVKILYLRLEDYYASSPNSGAVANRIGFDNTARAPLLPRAYEDVGRISEEDDVGNHTANRVDTDNQDVDVCRAVGCGSTLGNLLRFILGDQLKFRILIEVVGTTVHFIRREKSSQETIRDVRGFGHSFPENYTTWDPAVRGSSSHQRIIKYRLGGLVCLVRFEADGYLPDKVGTIARKARNVADETRSTEKEDDQSPDELLSSLNVSRETSFSSKAGLKITHADYVVPQRAIFDLKTRSVKRKPQEAGISTGEMPRVWLRQIPNFVLAYHSFGVFDDIQIRNVRTDMANREKQNADSLTSFANLLGKIVNFPENKKNGRLEITCHEGQDFLALRALTTDIRPAFTPLTEVRWRAWLVKGSSHDTETCQDVKLQCNSFQHRDAAEESRADMEDLYDVDEGVSVDYTVCDEEFGYCGHCH